MMDMSELKSFLVKTMQKTVAHAHEVYEEECRKLDEAWERYADEMTEAACVDYCLQEEVVAETKRVYDGCAQTLAALEEVTQREPDKSQRLKPSHSQSMARTIYEIIFRVMRMHRYERRLDDYDYEDWLGLVRYVREIRKSEQAWIFDNAKASFRDRWVYDNLNELRQGKKIVPLSAIEYFSQEGR